jgi:hypothetical protein
MIRGRNAQIRQSKAVCSLEPGWFLVLERVSQMSGGPFKGGMAPSRWNGFRADGVLTRLRRVGPT